ncbi:MAG: prolipoprotein diacylglyceryl transferase [Desulfobacteraceae bacterium]|nr:prolipoprotein diacylglyceryl transferase [Desulfobacteraceae bacterium]
MHPLLIQAGPLAIRWYGVMIALGCLVGLWVARREAERKGIGKDKIENFSLFAIASAVIGARLYYMAFSGGTQFWDNPLSLFAVWQGGLAIHGGIIGGLLVGIFYTRLQKLSFWRFADTFAPALILGQAIGRIGCFLNGDAYGSPTSLPWGMVYAPESPAGQMFPAQALHPTQLYEMVFNLIIFGILWKIRKKMKVDGHLFLLYVVLYSAIRIFVEHFRADKLIYWGNVSGAQSIGIAGVILGAGLMLALMRKRSSKMEI